MRRVLVLGAGKSSPYLIRHLLAQAADNDWSVIVADLDAEVAADRIGDHPRGEAIALDVSTPGRLSTSIENADVVVNLLPPRLQGPVARRCVDLGRHMVSPSYASPESGAVGRRRAPGVCLLDGDRPRPGHRPYGVHGADRPASTARAGIVERFESYGSGVPAPDSVSNPLALRRSPGSPTHVVRAGRRAPITSATGSSGPYPSTGSSSTWPVEVGGVGTMEAYPNRDSLAYRDIFGLAQARTLIRGTLRIRAGAGPGDSRAARAHHRGHCHSPSRGAQLPGLVEMFLPEDGAARTVEERTAAALGLDPDGEVMANLRWLGLFLRTSRSAETRCTPQTPWSAC